MDKIIIPDNNSLLMVKERLKEVGYEIEFYMDNTIYFDINDLSYGFMYFYDKWEPTVGYPSIEYLDKFMSDEPTEIMEIMSECLVDASPQEIKKGEVLNDIL